MSRSSSRAPRILGDGWYSWIGSRFVPLTDVVSGLPGPLQRLVLGVGALRGCALALASVRFGAVAVIRYDPGWRSLLLLRAVCGRRRKLVVLQFIDHPPSPRGLRRIGDLVWAPIDRWSIRRAMKVGHVLSRAELIEYPRRFGVEAERFRLIPWLLRRTPRDGQPPAPADGPVLAAGRAHCDWHTLLAAAARRNWDLTIVCAAGDVRQVEDLNTKCHASARVLSEVPHAQMRAILNSASVCVICLQDGVTSRGHVRLCDATDAGAAVVATDVRSFEGYVEPGRTALLVPPGDARALRTAVEQLLQSTELRRRVAEAAFEHAATWTGQHYLNAIERLGEEAAACSP